MKIYLVLVLAVVSLICCGAYSEENQIVLRGASLIIKDGTDANTLKCEVFNRWNGDRIAETDNIVKGGTTGHFTLDATGVVLRIEASGLTGNCLYVIGVLARNTSGTDLTTMISAHSDDIKIWIYNSTTAVQQDMTALVDAAPPLGDVIYIEIFYITDA